MKSKKILIVEDNDLNRKLFENLLGSLYSFEVAKNGLEALHKIQEQQFDLILMDIQMPQMDGITAMKKIKALVNNCCPILAVTAYAEENERAVFLDQGFDDLIIKPIRPREFLHTVQSYLQPISEIEEETESEIQDVILDKKILGQLFKYNSKFTIKKVFKDFEKECQIVQDKMQKLPEGKEELLELIHSLKGNSGTLGAQRIFLTSQKLEACLKSEEMENWAELKAKLEFEIKELNEFLNQETIFES
ncbi:response regulator [Algoriphagus mannitolivorans]|uniref:response regulator n=1 Tax=Algoriphagus mannitolivorans TaxID=226504 RepID=UPI00041319B2|nr:response regulator [Algoriphagus mannitolivorans]